MAEKSMDLKNAEHKMEQAIHDWIQAGGGDKQGMVVDYLVIIEQQAFDEDGDPEFTLKWKGRKGQPYHRNIGLMETLLVRLRAQIAGNADIAHRMP